VRRAGTRATPLPAPTPPPVQPAVAPPRAAAAPAPEAPPEAGQDDTVARLMHVVESLLASKRARGLESPPPAPTPAVAVVATAPQLPGQASCLREMTGYEFCFATLSETHDPRDKAVEILGDHRAATFIFANGGSQSMY
jgi:hypothetical protein